MRRLGRVATAFFMWMTLASFLLGITPHLTCRCPDGTLKFFCSGQGSAKSSCCCQGACASSNSGTCCEEKNSLQGEETPGHCCCKKSAGNHAQPPSDANDQEPGPVSHGAGNGGLCIHQSGCQKTLAKAEILTVVRWEISPIGHDDAPLPDVALLGLEFPPVKLDLRASWQDHRRPPPPDLVIVFKHFLI